MRVIERVKSYLKLSGFRRALLFEAWVSSNSYSDLAAIDRSRVEISKDTVMLTA